MLEVIQSRVLQTEMTRGGPTLRELANSNGKQ